MRGWRHSLVIEHTCLAHRNPRPPALAPCTWCMVVQTRTQGQEAKAGDWKRRVNPPSAQPDPAHPSPWSSWTETITENHNWPKCREQMTVVPSPSWHQQHNSCSPSWRVISGRGRMTVRTRGKEVHPDSSLRNIAAATPIKSHQQGFINKTWARETPNRQDNTEGAKNLIGPEP